MEKFSFASALLGCFITAVFSYIAWTIQKSISMRDERKRVAFFYLVKISEILAIKKAAEFAFKDEFSDLKKKIGNEEYSIHLFCAGFSKLLNGGMSDEFKSLINSLAGVFKHASMDRGDCFGYKINDEIVSKFPQSAIFQKINK